MRARSSVVTNGPAKSSLRRTIALAAAFVLISAMALSTKVIRLDSVAGGQAGGFSAAEFGKSAFAKVQAAIEQRAVGAATLASAIAKDQAAAAKQYGVVAGVGPEFSVKFSGVVGKGDFGTYDVSVEGVPKPLVIRVQTGPAIMGTDLRDATGTINFGQFTNQIDYQNAGSSLNKVLKKDVLSKIDTSNLKGKTISVVGAFQLTDPKSWLVTPVKLDVQ